MYVYVLYYIVYAQPCVCICEHLRVVFWAWLGKCWISCWSNKLRNPSSEGNGQRIITANDTTLACTGCNTLKYSNLCIIYVLFEEIRSGVLRCFLLPHFQKNLFGVFFRIFLELQQLTVPSAKTTGSIKKHNRFCGWLISPRLALCKVVHDRRANTLPVDKKGAQAPQGVTTTSSQALSGRSLPQPYTPKLSHSSIQILSWPEYISRRVARIQIKEESPC